jgi:hypothetical protein
MAEEKQALEERATVATTSCAKRKCSKSLARFQGHVQKSRAVLCRSLNQTMSLVSTDNSIYASFYDLVRAKVRRPEETTIDQDRLIADDLLFPHYREEIRFAALSMNGIGMRAYGECSMVLADSAIRHRATVFEKNSLDFCRERKLGVGNPVPFGYRALWHDRGTLAAAKLHDLLEANTTPDQYTSILLNETKRDFIEVHVFGPIHRRSIEEITVTTTGHSSDEALLLEIERRVEEFGATVRRC